MLKELPRNEWFYCEHLFDKESSIFDVSDFSINPEYEDGQLLADYIKSSAFDDEKRGECRTYLVRDKITDEIAAFFSLRAGQVIREGIFDEEERHSFEFLSGTELACFAVNDTYLKKHPSRSGFGILVFDEMILPLAYEIGSLTGAAILFGYAVNDEGLMDYYVNKCGFSRLSKELENEINERFRSSFDDDCYFVYLPLFNI